MIVQRDMIAKYNDIFSRDQQNEHYIPSVLIEDKDYGIFDTKLIVEQSRNPLQIAPSVDKADYDQQEEEEKKYPDISQPQKQEYNLVHDQVPRYGTWWTRNCEAYACLFAPLQSLQTSFGIAFDENDNDNNNDDNNDNQHQLIPQNQYQTRC